MNESAPPKEVDFLIIGQGLAGSLLAWFLQKRNAKIYLIDNLHKGSSSKVAAGIINPITGRRLVKSWMVDELRPFAQQTYQAIEKTLSCSIYQERVIFRALQDVKAENQWDERSADPGYAYYLGNESPHKEVKQVLQPAFSWGCIHWAAQVNIPELIRAFNKHFKDQQALSEEQLNYKKIKFLPGGGIRYNNIVAKHIIFCEGHQARFNPWFGYLPFVVSKGEILEIELRSKVLLPMIKHRAYIAPLNGLKYWIGATYDWDDLSDEPTEKARAQLVKSLEKSISRRYTITAHHAAIRPTVKDRRPFLGTHPDHKCLHIFNGLGTKGASLGPFWGAHFADYLCGGIDIDARVDIGRFTS